MQSYSSLNCLKFIKEVHICLYAYDLYLKTCPPNLLRNINCGQNILLCVIVSQLAVEQHSSVCLLPLVCDVRFDLNVAMDIGRYLSICLSLPLSLLLLNLPCPPNKQIKASRKCFLSL